MRSTEIENRKPNLRKFQTSIYRHIDDLSGKHYQLLEIQSPDFVLMFLPIEAVFSTVMQTDPEIFQRAQTSELCGEPDHAACDT